jgi:hypothetical protein
MVKSLSSENDVAEQAVVIEFTPFATPDIHSSPSREVVFETREAVVDDGQPIVEPMEMTEDSAHVVLQEPTMDSQDENNSDPLVKAISLLAISQEGEASVDQSQNPHSTSAFPEDMHEPSQDGAIYFEQADTALPAEQPEDQIDTQVMGNATEESGPSTTDNVSIDPDDEYVLMKRKHWQESPFAVGLVNPKWSDDRISCRKANATGARFEHFLTAYICGCVGAGRVGNMAVLAQGVEEYKHIELDEETGEQIVTRQMRPTLVWVVGPYWPINWFITFPLIFAIAIWTALTRVNESSVGIQVTYWMCIILLVYSLCMVACRNPGIMYRQSVKPEGVEGWRWNDQARTWRPPKARYDPECAVVVDGFDHT